MFALKKAQFYRIINVPDWNSKRSKTRLICEEKEKYAPSRKLAKRSTRPLTRLPVKKLPLR